MALAQIEFFRKVNVDFRQLAALVHKHPSSKHMTRLRQISANVQEESAPFVESNLFKDINPDLVPMAAAVLVGEISQNREMTAAFGGRTYKEEEFDEEFLKSLVKRVQEEELDADSEDPEAIIIFNPIEQLSASSLIDFMGGTHEFSVINMMEALEESESVNAGLDREYERHERLRIATIGVVAFAGALSGSIVASKFKKRQ
jgi:hypothetical protein